MATIAWAQGLITKLVDWFTRKRNLGLGMLVCSSTALVGLASGDFSVEIKGFAGVLDAAKFSTGGGFQGALLNLAVCAVLLVWFLGAAMVLANWLQELREATVNRVLVVEMRGLEDTTDHPLIRAIPATLPGRRVDRLVNVRQKWSRLFEQLSPIYKWTPGGLPKVQSCPRRRASLATNAEPRWATRGAPGISFYAASASFGSRFR